MKSGSINQGYTCVLERLRNRLIIWDSEGTYQSFAVNDDEVNYKAVCKQITPCSILKPLLVLLRLHSSHQGSSLDMSHSLTFLLVLSSCLTDLHQFAEAQGIFANLTVAKVTATPTKVITFNCYTSTADLTPCSSRKRRGMELDDDNTNSDRWVNYAIQDKIKYK